MTIKTMHSMTGTLEEIASVMSAAGDAIRSEQMKELSSKLTEGRLTVALCGHFSAGKSTLINTLCGARLLPSSPIPTSANVVTIKGGEPARASVEMVRDGRQHNAEVELDELDRYCVDGEQFSSVTITYPSPLLGSRIVLLDTPGIDSTDDAHRMATESALHLADVVFYVMDYNHVQSEINFSFAKELKDWGKPLYLIVNQIDKHRERELSFQAYRQSVEEAFQAWHLQPSGILYLSLRQPEHPHHEWNKLTGLLQELAERREELCAYSVDQSLRHMMEGHLAWRHEQQEPERAALQEQAGGESAAAANEIAEIKRDIDRIRQESEGWIVGRRAELQTMLDNANITPAALRDLAQHFLESRKPGFKAGLLFAAAKTAAEQEKRLKAFHDELATLIRASIEWHAKAMLRKAGEEVRYDSEQLEALLEQGLSWSPDEAWLVNRVNAKAEFGNAYTIVYCRELAQDVKGEFRRRAMELIERLAAQRAAEGQSIVAEKQHRLDELAEAAIALEQLEALERQDAGYRSKLQAMLSQRPEAPMLPKPSSIASGADASALSGNYTTAGQAEAHSKPEKPSKVSGDETDISSSIQEASKDTLDMTQQYEAAARLKRAASLLEPYPSMRDTIASMLEKSDRLSDSSFTIALFGAFSAGKSSLANALIGEDILPVSPNPTTAAINRLVPPSALNPHNTALITMKEREAITADLRYSLALLGLEASREKLPDSETLLRVIGKLSPESIPAGGRPHYSFLKAAAAGWQLHEAHLGKQLTVDAEQYRAYVADETRSCFVSEIDFHYDCPLTKQGIVLVDTPGADSVNARHTGVAFNYIKNADAVLFVTYYNHAFSQADRQFLDQLGRVKDQFELDKMFFLVNAADLAASEEELQGVQEHVKANLQQHGILKPRLYAVSSLQALDGKLDHDHALLMSSGMPVFEKAFFSFIRHDLGGLAIEAAAGELQRAEGMVSQWLRSAQGDKATKDRELKQLDAAMEAAYGSLQELADSGMPDELKQELKELLFYVVQRVQFRFGDFYNYAFNPASLKDDGSDLKRALWAAWLELQRIIQRELSQELLATSLRMEKGLLAVWKKPYGRCVQWLAELLDGYAGKSPAEAALTTPEESAVWEGSGVDAKWLWSRFKSPRHFFEGEGKSVLRKELETMLPPGMQQWMDNVALDWMKHYEELWAEHAATDSALLRSDAEAYAEGKRNSLREGADIRAMTELHEQLQELCAKPKLSGS
ncbi:dynamin family protein [Paenibacillus sp. J5C_2022]|uniref:dynamin family protein n=1 Tax=Paenibacillus sp. J5C2022 TaxID=2977129 RepID=UPI0021CED59D|nr:dynamin family protein [Paenibacillus sp. J5C2022]MCU6708287.1 dynamin family protein [Paenibacillus sp. J5C2022]